MPTIPFPFRGLPAIALAVIALPRAGAEPVDLPLRHLTLYSSGVGYFEHAGAVPAGGEVALDFTAEQLNDVLKSLLVRGSAGSVAVNYPGQEPVAQRLAGFGINLAENTTPQELLRQLRGVPVSVTLLGDPQPVQGRVVNVYTRTRVVGEPAAKIDEPVVTLATGAGLRTVSLDQVEHFQIEDAGLREEMDKALALLGSTRDRDARPVTIHFEKPSDLAAVSYLLEMPLWKVSYRLDLSADKPLLQGWAVVDNTTDRDWEQVAVTLVSGRPVSFVQDLYSPEFLARPVVQADRHAGLRPQEYAVGRKRLSSVASDAPRRNEGGEPASPMPAAMAAESDGHEAAGAVLYDSLQAYPANWAQATSGLQTAAASGDLGELFAYQIARPVTLARGASAMLPIVNADVQAQRVSIYNPAVQPKHPMRGVRLTNTTDLKLDAGPVTVFDDGAYAGDARVGFLAPGDDRLLSYALDLEVTIDPSARSDTRLLTATISRGVLMLSHSTRHEQTYAVRNASAQPRALLIEHPRTPGRELKEPAPKSKDDPTEQTETLYRFPLDAPAGKTVELHVVEDQPHLQTVQLARHNADQLVAFAADGRFPKRVREALAEAGGLQRQLEDTARLIAAAEQRVNEITAEQDRLRRNMGSVDRTSALYKRYVEKLDEQETTLESLGADLADLRAQSQQRATALADFLDQLTVE